MRLFLLSTVAGGLPWEGIGASGAGCGPAPEAVFGAMVSHRASFLAGMRQHADCRPGAVRGYRAAALALPRLKAA